MVVTRIGEVKENPVLKISLYSLRTGIMAQLTFLIVAAMLLINVVMIRFAERDLVDAKLDAGQLVIYAVEQNLRHIISQGGSKLTELDTDPRFRKTIGVLLAGSGFADLLIVDAKGKKVFDTHLASGLEDRGVPAAKEAAASGLWTTRFSGTAWGVVWMAKSDVTISAPIFLDSRPMGGMALRGSLIPIYETLRTSETWALFYILLDSLILVTVGILLLSRIVVKPIHKLLKMTEDYKEGDMVLSLGEASGNEIGDLSRSLSIMLKRLDENKKELKAHISSLEKANKDLQQAQDEIIRSEKLASVGRLSAGIAHEIGNPIGIILGYLDLLNSDDIREEEKKDFLKRIEAEIIRVKEIIKQLLDFSRPSNGERGKTHIHEMITSTLTMLSPQPIMENIQTSTQLMAEEDVVLADPGQLQQVFLNIILNAADALAEKRLSGEEGDEKKLTVITENKGNWIQIRFSDTGRGIPQQELTRIFDPFYTTKEPGKGTGLGLSVCYRIVEGLGGTISAESTAGKGATIIVTLPLTSGEDPGGSRDA
jgi:two-component system NtrC family sensor kinase